MWRCTAQPCIHTRNRSKLALVIDPAVDSFTASSLHTCSVVRSLQTSTNVPEAGVGVVGEVAEGGVVDVEHPHLFPVAAELEPLGVRGGLACHHRAVLPEQVAVHVVADVAPALRGDAVPVPDVVGLHPEPPARARRHRGGHHLQVQVTRACRAGRVNHHQQHEQRHQRMAEEQELERHDEQLVLRPNHSVGGAGPSCLFRNRKKYCSLLRFPRGNV